MAAILRSTVLLCTLASLVATLPPEGGRRSIWGRPLTQGSFNKEHSGTLQQSGAIFAGDDIDVWGDLDAGDDIDDNIDFDSEYDLEAIPAVALLSNFVRQFVPPEFRDPRIVWSVAKPSFPAKITPLMIEYNTERHSMAKREGFSRQQDQITAQERFTGSGHVMSMCDSATDWFAKETSEDVFGNHVTILQQVNIGGTLVNQYFYETRCVAAPGGGPRQCRGVDTHQFYSRCVEKYMRAYARVRNAVGDRGWAFVKVRASCNCGIQRKTFNTK